MVEFGIHPFVWTPRWNGESVPLIGRAKALGYSVMDIPVRTLNEEDIRATKARLAEMGMHAVAVAGIAAQYDLTSDDESVRRAALEYIRKLVTNAHDIGATVLAGVYYVSVGKIVGRPPTEEELTRSADGLRLISRFARDWGVKLALEPVNRYETYVLNTVAQTLQMIDRIGEPNVGLLFDTYQMITEEKDYYQSIVSAGNRVYHVHACENDRGIPGSGLVPWHRVFKALHDINYQGALTVETFVSSIPEIAASTRIWRQVIPDADTLARDGLAFLTSMAREYGLTEETTHEQPRARHCGSGIQRP